MMIVSALNISLTELSPLTVCASAFALRVMDVGGRHRQELRSPKDSLVTTSELSGETLLKTSEKTLTQQLGMYEILQTK